MVSVFFSDVDECAEADEGGCEHTCTNYEGGYYCSCNDGYRLMGDDKSCEGTNIMVYGWRRLLYEKNRKGALTLLLSIKSLHLKY